MTTRCQHIPSELVAGVAKQVEAPLRKTNETQPE
jgi:hypothetical protein